jgi:hypothetical protein
MAHALAQVRLQRTNNLPEDAVVNTFHFFTTGATVTPAQAGEIATKVISFYNGGPPADVAIAMTLSPILSRNALASQVKVYDMGQPMPRQPVVTQPWTLGNSAGFGPMPSEVALVLSLRATVTPGTSPARARGRVYVGPLNVGCLGDAGAGDVRPEASYQQAILKAGVRMLAAPADLIAWSVFSTKDQVLRRITSVVVDNAFDTQRRRGSAPTARIVGSLSQV